MPEFDALKSQMNPPRGLTGVRNTNAPAAPSAQSFVRPQRPLGMALDQGGRPPDSLEAGLGAALTPPQPQTPIPGLAERANRFAGLPARTKIRTDGIQKEGKGGPVRLNARGVQRFDQARERLRQRWGFDPFALEPNAPRPDLSPGSLNFNPFTGEWVSEE